MASLVLFHDYTSPGSAVAVFRLQRLADEGLPVMFEGFDVLGIDATLPPTLDILAAVENLRDVAAGEGVVLHRPARLPPTAPAHVLEMAAGRCGLGASWRQTCYRAFWEERADIGDRGVLARLARDAGLDEDEARVALSDRLLLTAVRRRAAARRREGVGGVPTILSHGTFISGLTPEDDLRLLARL